MGPALIMAETRAYMRIVAHGRADAGLVFTQANQALADDLEDSERFVTSLLVRLSAATRSIAYVNAGHLAGCVLGCSGAIRSRLARRGPPLGMFADTPYVESAAPLLEPGELLFLYTDGIVEAERADGERFGTQRLIEAIRRNRERPAQQIVEAVREEIRGFEGEGGPHDDLTLVVLKVG